MRNAYVILLLALTGGQVSPLQAQQLGAPAPATVQPVHRALRSLTPPGAIRMMVSTPSWTDGSDIPFENTQYRENVFPGLNWTSGPARTRFYAIIMQDMDSGRDGVHIPTLHWTMLNIPSSVLQLPVSMQPDDRPQGSSYGPNYKGLARPYLGPRTPPGPKHHYHIQVFALDTRIATQGIADCDTLLDRMKGHVLASGEVIGLGQAPSPSQER